MTLKLLGDQIYKFFNSEIHEEIFALIKQRNIRTVSGLNKLAEEMGLDIAVLVIYLRFKPEIFEKICWFFYTGAEKPDSFSVRETWEKICTTLRADSSKNPNPLTIIALSTLTANAIHQYSLCEIAIAYYRTIQKTIKSPEEITTKYLQARNITFAGDYKLTEGDLQFFKKMQKKANVLDLEIMVEIPLACESICLYGIKQCFEVSQETLNYLHQLEERFCNIN